MAVLARLIAAFRAQIVSSETVSVYITTVSLSHPQSQIFSSFQASSYMKPRNCTLKRVIYYVWLRMHSSALYSLRLEHKCRALIPFAKRRIMNETRCAYACPPWLTEPSYSNCYRGSVYFLHPDLPGGYFIVQQLCKMQHSHFLRPDFLFNLLLFSPKRGWAFCK